MDQPRTISNPLDRLKAQIEALPGELASLCDQLPPPKFHTEVQRILTKLDSQVAQIKAKGLDVEALETKLTAVRAEQEI